MSKIKNNKNCLKLTTMIFSSRVIRSGETPYFSTVFNMMDFASEAMGVSRFSRGGSSCGPLSKMAERLVLSINRFIEEIRSRAGLVSELMHSSPIRSPAEFFIKNVEERKVFPLAYIMRGFLILSGTAYKTIS